MSQNNKSVDPERTLVMVGDIRQALVDMDAIEKMKIMEFVDFSKMKYFDKLRTRLTADLHQLERQILAIK